MNQVLTLPVSVVVFYFDKWRGVSFEQKLPDLVTTVGHLIGCIIVVEIGFYYTHRLLHHPYLYKQIHKKHHTWISPVAISAAYCHPIEHLASNMLPVVLGNFF